MDFDQRASLCRQKVISEHSWLRGGFLNQLLTQESGIQREELRVRRLEEYSIAICAFVDAQDNLQNISNLGRADYLESFVGSFFNFCFNKHAFDSALESLLDCPFAVNSNRTNIFLRSWIKAQVRDIFFPSHKSFPHYCVGVENSLLSHSQFDDSLPEIHFVLGPYMYLSMGHMDYILMTLIAVELLLENHHKATLSLIGDWTNAPFSELIRTIASLDYVTTHNINELQPREHVHYATVGDEKSFFAASKILEFYGYASFMGFGQLITDQKLRQFNSVERIRAALNQRLARHHLQPKNHFAIHARTHSYKSDDHMAFRNSDICDLVAGLPERFSSSHIGIVGHYPSCRLENAINMIQAIGSLPLLAPAQSEDLYIAATSIAFISTSSGPGHIAAYFVPTLFLNATCLTPTNLFTDLITISLKRIAYKIQPSRVGVSLEEIIDLLLEDYWATDKFSSIFSLSSLGPSDVRLELIDWLDNKDQENTYTIGSLSHQRFKTIPNNQVRITRRTYDMLNGLILSYS